MSYLFFSWISNEHILFIYKFYNMFTIIFLFSSWPRNVKKPFQEYLESVTWMEMDLWMTMK